MTIGSLFSGIGGIDLGLESLGLGPTLWNCDADPCSRAVLAEHWPHAKTYADVRDIDERAARVDILAGGFPCQDISSANRKRLGLDGPKSGLWREFRRIVECLRPAVVFIENSPEWKLWVPAVRRDLRLLGYASLSVVVSAADVGAPFLGKRAFVLAAAPNGEGKPDVSRYAEVAELPALAIPTRWSVDPDPAPFLGVADGLPRRMDRLRLLGNACVPAQAALAFRTLIARAAE